MTTTNNQDELFPNWYIVDESDLVHFIAPASLKLKVGDKLDRRNWKPIAEYVGNGYVVTIKVVAMPARFYTLSYVTDDGSEIVMTTGSGEEMAVLCHVIASSIVDGMLEISHEHTPK